MKLTPKVSFWVLFGAILAIGIFARAWAFGVIPPGLNKDEASIGVEAYDLLHYGMDRNGVSYPVHLISWGSGQNALYAYLLIPFVYLFGLSPFVVRLPMLFTGILSLPLIYWMGFYTLGKKGGLLAMFFLAIAPWHIMMSRWGLESNILPFIFLIGFVCLLKSIERNIWFIPACVTFALCLYAYGTAYAAIPLFLAGVFILLVRRKGFKLKFLFFGLFIAAIISLPIAAFVAVNSFKLGSIHLGPVTIPRLPAQPRYETISTVFNPSNYLHGVYTNAILLLKLLITQTDGNNYNVLDPYGYFYSLTFPIAILGAILMFPLVNRKQKITEILFVMLWLFVSIIVGVIQHVNINRINIIFIPLIFCTSIFFLYLYERVSKSLIPIVIVFFTLFCLFISNYIGRGYTAQVNEEFFNGIIPAIIYASNSNTYAPVCISEQIDTAYIYVLFSETPNPSEYLHSIEIVDPKAEFRVVTSLGRYKFDSKKCDDAPDTIYIFQYIDKIPLDMTKYVDTRFENYLVFVPKP
jgi:hypothetical protein